jgi:mRNA-degrading endonuclease RelE of RelBE toxin-antitoxin system
MPFKIEATPEFLNEAKKLAKKYPSVKNDIAGLAEQLTTNPTQGISPGKDAYKIRLAITSKGKGKSGGQGLLPVLK